MDFALKNLRKKHTQKGKTGSSATTEYKIQIQYSNLGYLCFLFIFFSLFIFMYLYKFILIPPVDS